MKALRKIFTAIIILALSMSVMAGCKENQVEAPKTISAGNESTDVSSNTSAGTTVNDSKSQEEVIKQGTIKKNGNVILKELAFIYNGKTIAISDIADDEKLEGILGKAEGKKTHTYSNDDGRNMDTLIGFTEKQYKFPGIDIKTINAAEDKKFYIFSVKITDSKYPTVRNIKVGDSLDKLKEAYPEGNMVGGGAGDEEDDYQYLPVNYVDGMKFHIKDKKVESILMYKLLD